MFKSLPPSYEKVSLSLELDNLDIKPCLATKI